MKYQVYFLVIMAVVALTFAEEAEEDNSERESRYYPGSGSFGSYNRGGSLSNYYGGGLIGYNRAGLGNYNNYGINRGSSYYGGNYGNWGGYNRGHGYNWGAYRGF